MAAIMTHGTTEAITVDIMTLGIMVDTTTHGTTEDIMADIGAGTIHGTTITTTADGTTTITTITMATRTYHTATTPPISVQDTGPGQRPETLSVQAARPA